jgi:CBS domain-containing protein
MLVRHVMRATPVTATLSTRVIEALALLDEHSLSVLPVVDERGRLRGVVREVDLFPDAATVARPDAPALADVQTRRPVGVQADDTVYDAIELMALAAVSDLPVVNGLGMVVGSISRDDASRALSRTDHEVEREVADLFTQLGFRHWQLTVTDGIVEVSDLATGRDRTLGRVAALTVPGVREVVWA